MTRDPTKWRLVPVEPTEEQIEAGIRAARAIDPIGNAFGARLLADVVRAALAAALAAAPPPPAGDADAGAHLIAEWLGYAWDGLREGSSVERGYPVWAFSRYGGYSLQGGHEDLRILARRIAALSAGEAVAEAVAAEREAIAQLAEYMFDRTVMDREDRVMSNAAREIAAAIRARSEGQHG